VTGWLTLPEYAEAWADIGDGDPYFRPEFLAASALAEGGEPAAFRHEGVLYPFIVRPLAEGRCDITTAYGFGGPYGSGAWREPFLHACAQRGVVSEFVRFHPVRRNHEHAGGDVSLMHVQDMVVLDVQADDEELVRRMVPQARNKLRKAYRKGVHAEESRDLERFWRVYTEAMHEIGAADHYFFPLEYFEALDALGDGLTMLDAGSAAALFLSGAGAMHYFLSASTDEGRRSAATNLVIYEAMLRARDAGLGVLNLGGGLTDGDALHSFKRSFGPGGAPYFVGRAVHDADAYRRLSEEAGVDPRGDYFPAYRGAPAASPA
jgi:hypothetical protein